MATDLTYDYDSIGDTLYIFEGVPRDTRNIDIEDNIVLRVDPKAHRAVGMMVHNVSLIYGQVDKRTLDGMLHLAKALLRSYNLMLERYPDAEQALVGQTA